MKRAGRLVDSPDEAHRLNYLLPLILADGSNHGRTCLEPLFSPWGSSNKAEKLLLRSLTDPLQSVTSEWALTPKQESRLRILIHYTNRVLALGSDLAIQDSALIPIGTLLRRVLRSVPHTERMAIQEWFGFVPISAASKVGSFCLVARGGLTQVHCPPGEFFARLLPLRAQSYVAIHNHPSGRLEPSPEDQCLVGELEKLARILAVPSLGLWLVGPHSARFFPPVSPT